MNGKLVLGLDDDARGVSTYEPGDPEALTGRFSDGDSSHSGEAGAHKTFAELFPNIPLWGELDTSEGRHFFSAEGGNAYVDMRGEEEPQEAPCSSPGHAPGKEEADPALGCRVGMANTDVCCWVHAEHSPASPQMEVFAFILEFFGKHKEKFL